MGQSLYEVALGRAWDALPEPLRRCHSPGVVASGRFKIKHARSWFARLLIVMMRLPRAGRDVATELRVHARERHQDWIRHFDGRPMITRQYFLASHRVAERRGPIELAFDIVAAGGEVHYVPDAVRLCVFALRIPLPAWFAPRVRARCWVEPGASAMNVKVQIAVPVFGELVTYGGALEPR